MLWHLGSDRAYGGVVRGHLHLQFPPDSWIRQDARDPGCQALSNRSPLRGMDVDRLAFLRPIAQ